MLVPICKAREITMSTLSAAVDQRSLKSLLIHGENRPLPVNETCPSILALALVSVNITPFSCAAECAKATKRQRALVANKLTSQQLQACAVT